MKLTPLRARMLKVPSPKYTASAPASIAACKQVKSPAGASISGFFILGNYTKNEGRCPVDATSRRVLSSTLQPIVADRNPWIDLNVDSFIRAACVQPCHPAGYGRTAHAQLSRHLFPTRTNQPRLGIGPPPKVLHDPLSEFKRNLRRTSPWIPCRSMRFRHMFTFLAPTPYRRGLRDWR